MIKKRDDSTNTAETGIIMLLYGAPGVGKTTLACSADNAIVLDTDKGMKRVSIAHRADYSSATAYKELLQDMRDGIGHYDTVVVDTINGTLEMLGQDIIEENPKMAQSDGSLTLKAYGALKQRFLSFCGELRRGYKNVVFVCHEYASRDGDNQFFDLVISGSTKQLVWQPIDLGARCFIKDGKRYLGFTPQDTYNAKSSFGIKGLIEVPDLKPGEPNNFLSKLFAVARANMKAEAETLAPLQKDYEEAIALGKEIVEALTKVEDVATVLEAIGNIKHALTSEKEIKAMLRTRLTELNIVYDRESKSYKYAEKK